MFSHSTTENDITIAKLMPLMGHITCIIRNRTSKIYKDLGYSLTPEAVDTLMIIQHFDGLPQKCLADILGKDKAAITRLLNTLVKSQLVERVQDLKDRRITKAHITSEGKRAFKQIYPKLEQLSTEMLQGIAPQDFKCTLKTLSSIIENISPQPRED